MKLLLVPAGIAEDVKAFLLFDELSGLMLGLFYLIGRSVIERTNGIWLIDMTPNNQVYPPPASIAHLLKNICSN